MPLTLKRANRLVAEWHRHHRPTQGGLFAIGCGQDGELVGAVICGRPVSRMLDDGETVEVTRCVTNGTRNACSFLYRAAARAAVALGYSKLITYTLDSESGASLKGAGMKCVGLKGGGNWNKPGRARRDTELTQQKLRWEIEL